MYIMYIHYICLQTHQFHFFSLICVWLRRVESRAWRVVPVDWGLESRVWLVGPVDWGLQSRAWRQLRVGPGE